MSGASTAAGLGLALWRSRSRRPRSFRRPARPGLPSRLAITETRPDHLGKADSSPVGLPLQASSSPLRLGLAPAGPSGGRFFVYARGNARSRTHVRGCGRGRTIRGATLLTIYRDDGEARGSHTGELPEKVIWLDLLNPTEDEKAFVENRAGLRVPSFEALSEIESSSRRIVDHGGLSLTMPLGRQG